MFVVAAFRYRLSLDCLFQHGVPLFDIRNAVRELSNRRDFGGSSPEQRASSLHEFGPRYRDASLRDYFRFIHLVPVRAHPAAPAVMRSSQWYSAIRLASPDYEISHDEYLLVTVNRMDARQLWIRGSRRAAHNCSRCFAKRKHPSLHAPRINIQPYSDLHFGVIVYSPSQCWPTSALRVKLAVVSSSVWTPSTLHIFLLPSV